MNTSLELGSAIADDKGKMGFPLHEGTSTQMKLKNLPWFHVSRPDDLASLGLGGRLCRRTTVPRLYSIMNGQIID